MIIMQLVTGIIPLIVLIALNTRIYLAMRDRMRMLASMSSNQRR
jgi:sorbitol-specific phosphotransferase system component IIC